eukprot:scaffold58799_cov28-Tisochrysis_lutea.AAC.2
MPGGRAVSHSAAPHHARIQVIRHAATVGSTTNASAGDRPLSHSRASPREQFMLESRHSSALILQEEIEDSKDQ